MVKMKIPLFLKNYYDRFVSLKGDPKTIALGFAVGTFMAFYPIIGTKHLVLVGVAALFRLHLVSMLLAHTLIMNPLTMAPILAADFYIGRWVLRLNSFALPEGQWSLEVILSLGWEVIASLLVGGVLIGGLSAVLCYPAAKWAVVAVRLAKNKS